MLHDVLAVDRLPIPPVVEAVAFWSAIVLPFVYLPLLLIGLDTMLEQNLFLLLLGLNVVMVVLGHRHHQD